MLSRDVAGRKILTSAPRRVLAWCRTLTGNRLAHGWAIPRHPHSHVLLINLRFSGFKRRVVRPPTSKPAQSLLTLLQEERIRPTCVPPVRFRDTAALGAIYTRSTWGKVIVER